MRKYKVTGKFCVSNNKGEIIKDEVFINKIEEEKDSRTAMEFAIKKTTEVFAKKYDCNVELQQISTVLVKII